MRTKYICVLERVPEVAIDELAARARRVQIPVVSLFCGAGGLDIGFRDEGFKTVIAFDNSKRAISTFNLNAKRKIAIKEDLATISAGTLVKRVERLGAVNFPRGIIGGPPCQCFSRGNVNADPDDPRNQLPFRYAEIVAAFERRFRLEFFVFENVMGLKASKHKERLDKLHSALDAAGFAVTEHEVDASLYSVPQFRHRLFLVGLSKRQLPHAAFSFPKGEGELKTVRAAIGGLPRPVFFTRGLNSRDIPHHPNHWTMMPKSPKLINGLPGVGRSFRKLNWDEPSPTVAYGNREIHVHPDGHRRLSVYEAMLLQGFPPKYRLTGGLSDQITQVCNAVPPPVARILARRLRETIADTRPR
jgi:DNA (cytosine-5)-methyltransferase 1